MRRPGYPFLGYAALAAGVAGPLLGSGLILAVDAAPVPRAQLDPSYWGLGQGTHEGTVSRLPLDAVLAALGWLTSVALVQKCVLVVAIALAGWGMHRLVEVSHPGARVYAGLLYAVNPFVYERIWTGQLYVVLGYAVLPWAFAAFRSLLRRRTASPALFVVLALLVGIASPHMAILFGLMCALALVATAAVAKHRTRRGLLVAVAGLALAALGSAWWLLPTPGVTGLWSHIGRAQLALYASVPDPHLGLVPALLGLSGYWNDARPAISYVPAWPLVTVTLLVLSAGGAWLRRREPTTWAVAGAGLAGLLLALGYAWAPTRAPFVWLLAHFAPLRSFRESGKGLALLAFAYAYLGAVAVDDLVQHASPARRWRVVLTGLLVALPLTLGARELWGEWGQLHTSEYPASWTSADAYLDRAGGSSRTLVLPFHGYFALSFAHDRVVANPAAAYFRTPTLIGRSVGGPEDQTDPDQIRAEQLLSLPQHRPEFSACLAALGVGHILVLRQADWRSYGNLARRPGIAFEARWPGAALYRSLRPTSIVMARTGTGHGCRDWTPVPAVRVGTFDVRLLASPPKNTTLRVELPDGQNWQRTGTTTIHYAGWAPLRRNYEIGLALLVTVLLGCSLPFALAALKSVPMPWHRPSGRPSRRGRKRLGRALR